VVNDNNLVWIDLEFSGLDFNRDVILEIALVVTDKDLYEIDVFDAVIHQDDSILDNMDEWNTRTHNNSGLVEACRSSSIFTHDAERKSVEFVSKYVTKCVTPMCGSSVHNDRRMLDKKMPMLAECFSYRNMDVSSIKELLIRWDSEIVYKHKKHGGHRALDDVRASIEELKHYRRNVFDRHSYSQS